MLGHLNRLALDFAVRQYVVNNRVGLGQVVAKQAELAYSRGAIPLVDLLDARRTLRASLLDALNIQTGYAKSIGSWQIRQSIQNNPPIF